MGKHIHLPKTFLETFHYRGLDNKSDGLIAVFPVGALCAALLSVTGRRCYLSRDTVGKTQG